jgi:hypothetical protein
MKKLYVLRTLIDFAFYISCFTLFFVVTFVPLALLGYAGEIPIKLKGEAVFIADWPTKLILVFAGISTLIFIYCIYLLRVTVKFFIKRDLFNDVVIRNFNLIGVCIIVSTLSFVIPMFVYNLTQKNKYELSFDSGFDSPLLVGSLGLFFMILSEVFQTAKKLKEENDLTL